MAKRGVGGTATGAAISRLIEQYQPAASRIFEDPVVGELVGGPARLLVRLGAVRRWLLGKMESSGVYGLLVCRTRCIDDTVNRALADGIDQMLILGAGLDSRAYRLPAAREIRTFELDLPEVQAKKRRRLERHRRPLDRVTFVATDFDRHDLAAALTEASFDRARRSVVIWEGVTQYLSAEGVGRTLELVGSLAPGTVLVFTYVLESVIQRHSGIAGAKEMVDGMARRGAPWVFGLDPAGLGAFLKPFHLALQADAGAADYQQTFLRALRRKLSVSGIERVATARVIRPGH